MKPVACILKTKHCPRISSCAYTSASNLLQQHLKKGEPVDKQMQRKN
jgi:hypothetical protein